MPVRAHITLNRDHLRLPLVRLSDVSILYTNQPKLLALTLRPLNYLQVQSPNYFDISHKAKRGLREFVFWDLGFRVLGFAPVGFRIEGFRV